MKNKYLLKMFQCIFAMVMLLQYLKAQNSPYITNCPGVAIGLNYNFYRSSVPGATAYQYTIYKQGQTTSLAQYVRSSYYGSFRLSEICGPGIQYNSSYDITVQAMVNSIWGTPGTVCTVTTVDAPLPSITNCPVNSISLNYQFTRSTVPCASTYRYKIYDAIDQTVVAQYDRSDYYGSFRLSEICGGIEYGKSYNITVTAMVNSLWGDEGLAICSVTIVDAPTPSIINCPVSPITLPYQFSRNSIPCGAAYRYSIFESGTNNVVAQYIRSDYYSSFRLSEICDPDFKYNFPYDISVAAEVNSKWGQEGPRCTITILAPTIQLTSDFCPGNNISYTQNIISIGISNYCYPQYQFKIENTTLGFSETKISNDNIIQLKEFIGPIFCGVAYEMSVQALLNGSSGGYGNPCTITPECPFSISAITVDAACAGSYNGSIDLTVTNLGSAVPPYTYSWSNGATAQDISGLCAGTYSVTVKDANKAASTLNVSITQPPPIIANIDNGGETDIIFNGGTGQPFTVNLNPDVNLTVIASGGTGGLNYLWSTGEATETINVSYSNSTVNYIPGSYSFSVTVTDVAACTAVSSISIDVIDINTVANNLTNDYFPNGNSNSQNLCVCHLNSNVEQVNINANCNTSNSLCVHLLHGDNLTFCDGSQCPDGTFRKSNYRSGGDIESVDLVPGFGLYPNPNNGKMVLSYHLKEKEYAELIIYDVTGRKTNHYILDAKNSLLEINETGMNEGVYLYHILINGEIVFSDKISVIK